MLRIKVARLVRRLKLKTPFKNDVPGKDWIQGFLARHPDLSIRSSPTALSTVRARMLNPAVVDNYFVDLGRIISELGLENAPKKIWNIDDTSVALTHNPTKVLAETGTKNIPGRVGNSRDNVSVLAAVNATGDAIPPMVIVKGKTAKSLNAYDVQSGVPGTVYTYQQRSWMEDALSEIWFQDHFLKHCGPERPQLIMLDSHSSHETLGLLESAHDNQITLFAFLPHTTQWLCPLDKIVFGALSRYYNQICSDFMAASPGNIVCKWKWPALFRAAYEKAFTSSNIISGFQKSGIFPFDPSKITDQAFAPSQPFDCFNKSTANTSNTEMTTHNVQRVQSNTTSNTTNLSVADLHSKAMSSISEGAITPTIAKSSTAYSDDDSSEMDTPIHDINNCNEQPTPLAQTGGPITSPAAKTGGPTTDPITQAEGPSGATILSTEDLILSVLRGEIPSTEESGVITLEIPTIDPHEFGSIDQNAVHWSSSIESIFSVPESINETKQVSKKKLTSHRVLTSQEIIESKKLDKENKQKLEEEKNARQKEREMKKKGVKVLGQAKSIPLSKIKPCFVCKKKENKMVEKNVWVKCSACQHYFHEDCIPKFMASFLQSESFKCHICVA